MALPGPGGYEVNWAPGVRIFNLSASRSGHLTLPCDYYQGNPNVEQHMALMAKRLKNHTIRRPDLTSTTVRPVDKPKPKPAAPKTSRMPSETLPTTIPVEVNTPVPLNWPQFQKKWKGYPPTEVNFAYWAQKGMVPPLSEAERREEFERLYPIHASSARASASTQPRDQDIPQPTFWNMCGSPPCDTLDAADDLSDSGSNL